MELKVETITPKTALEYLKKNTNNYRKLSVAKVQIYADDMKKGRWQLNGEPIVFDDSGFLKDGQHRLAGIVKADVPVDIAVIRGVGRDVNIYDVGAVRTVGQIAKASGYDVNASMTGAISLYLNQFTNSPKGEILQYLKEHASDLRRAYSVIPGSDKRYCRKASCLLAAYLMLRTESMPIYELELFFRIFESMNIVGCDGYEPSPALVARRMFDERYKGGYAGRIAQREQLEIMILAMNDFHKKKARQLNYRISEPFTYEHYIEKVKKADGLE